MSIIIFTRFSSTIYFSDAPVMFDPSRSQENRITGAPIARQRSLADIPALLAVFDSFSVVSISGLSVTQIIQINF